MSFNYNHVQAEHSKMTENSLVSRLRKYFGISEKDIRYSIDEGKLTVTEPLMYIPQLDEFLGVKYFYCCRDAHKTMKLAALFNDKKFVKTTIYEAWNTAQGLLPNSEDYKKLVMTFNMFGNVYVMSHAKGDEITCGFVLPAGVTMEPIELFLRRLYSSAYEEEEPEPYFVED